MGNTQTTAERIAEDMGVPLGAAATIAAEIDAKNAEIAELKKALIDCQTYSANAGRVAHEYKNMLDRMLAKDGVLWTPDGGLSIIRG